MHCTAERQPKINLHSDSITVLGVYSNVVLKRVFLEAIKFPAVVCYVMSCILVL